jgi:hypothetical protein
MKVNVPFQRNNAETDYVNAETDYDWNLTHISLRSDDILLVLEISNLDLHCFDPS